MKKLLVLALVLSACAAPPAGAPSARPRAESSTAVVTRSPARASVTPERLPGGGQGFRAACGDSVEECLSLARAHCRGDFRVVDLAATVYERSDPGPPPARPAPPSMLCGASSTDCPFATTFAQTSASYRREMRAYEARVKAAEPHTDHSLLGECGDFDDGGESEKSYG